MKLHHLVIAPTAAFVLVGMLGCTPPRLALRPESARRLKPPAMKVVPWGTMDPLELGGGIAIEATF